MWNKGDWVVVISGTFGKENLKGVSFRIAQIVEEGLDDLLVMPKKTDWGTKKGYFVPKKMCRYIPIDIPDVYTRKRDPRVGDLVMYYYHSYSGTIEQSVSHVWELRGAFEASPDALITIGDENKWVSVENLLVLDVNKRKD